jgi:hypothetical protein
MDLRKKVKELRKENEKRARRKVVVKDKVKVEKSAGTFCQARQFSKAEKLTEPEPVLICIRNVSPFPSWATLFSSFLSFFIREEFTSPTLLSSHLPLPPIPTMAAPAPAEARVKPTKPDEEAYKASLAQAEKEHTAAQEKLVCLILLFSCISYTTVFSIES